MSQAARNPRAEIMELGSKITVDVTEGGQSRAVSVNVFDPSAPPFPANTPESSVCNSIKKEVLQSLRPEQAPAIPSPTKIRDLEKGLEKDAPGMSRSI